jgi:uncharacterized protein (DUF486 family)
MLSKVGIVLFVIAIVAWGIFYFSYTIHLHQTCDGHVVKNVFDWPVCVH